MQRDVWGCTQSHGTYGAEGGADGGNFGGILGGILGGADGEGGAKRTHCRPHDSAQLFLILLRSHCPRDAFLVQKDRSMKSWHGTTT